MTTTHNLGYPRIGKARELKKALENFWAGKSSEEELQSIAQQIRAENWQQQQRSGVDWIPVGDFSLYDHVLDITLLMGVIPPRFTTQNTGLDLYFALARGDKEQPPLELTKWFDTNYHYLVPEFQVETVFRPATETLFAQVTEAQALGIKAKPVLLGPVSYLYLGKEKAAGFDRLSLLPDLIVVYRSILERFKVQGIHWVQIDEPILALDLTTPWREALVRSYDELASVDINIMLTTYFGDVSDHAAWLKQLPVAGIHIDLVRAPHQLSLLLNNYPKNKILSCGVIDGRNVWRNDLDATLTQLQPAHAKLGERLWLAPSCSLLHCPVDLSSESKLNADLKSWLAFAVQKLEELSILKHGLNHGRSAIAHQLELSQRAKDSRARSPRIHNKQVKQRVASLTARDAERNLPFAKRIIKQRHHLNLPLLPTTTIGSFPQTDTIRNARATFKQGVMPQAQYISTMQQEIKLAIESQEKLGLDVLVHGEAERNDMVEYFGEQLEGYAFTQHGWVQSYGSRCVKPPIIYGDVYRSQPMTVEWIRYARSLTHKPVKGMLTGPITMLQWSFVRDDQARDITAFQIALALRDEVSDLERSGVSIIQIDEPAFREGLPLRKKEWEHILPTLFAPSKFHPPA